MLQCSTYVFDSNKDSKTTEDILKTHSLIHNQLSAPAFQPVLSYASHTTGLLTNETSKPIFPSINQVCFHNERNFLQSIFVKKLHL